MKLIIFAIVFLSTPFLFSQERISLTNASSYSIPLAEDTIQYIRLDSSTVEKPTILFLQGSLPIPLVIEFENFKHINLPFSIKSIVEKYHIVLISMPKTPVVVSHKKLSNQNCFITDSLDNQSFLAAYTNADYLSNYVNRTNQVIKDLNENQPWAKLNTIHLVGHSQGSKIAAVVAAENKSVVSVSLLGFNPYGRYDQLLRTERENLKQGIVTEQEYKNNIADLYEYWTDIIQNPTKENYKAWHSFSIDYTPYLMQISCPIFIGYGTNDIGAENCDLLPLEFIKNGKTNYTVNPYVGLEHNFFEMENGVINYEKSHWDEVVKDAIDFIENGY